MTSNNLDLYEISEIKIYNFFLLATYSIRFRDRMSLLLVFQ